VTTQEPPQRIGFVGLGQMGAPMARNLARAGFKLAVTDTNAAAVKRLGDTGFNESAGRRRKRELLRPPGWKACSCSASTRARFATSPSRIFTTTTSATSTGSRRHRGPP
jgi:hypothetical protein